MNLVLVHGILGFRKKFGVEYFRGVAEHFRAQGFAVLVPELDPTRGIEFRGNQLGDQINNGFNSGLPTAFHASARKPSDRSRTIPKTVKSCRIC
jgi:dienelactone hydrolase